MGIPHTHCPPAGPAPNHHRAAHIGNDNGARPQPTRVRTDTHRLPAGGPKGRWLKSSRPDRAKLPRGGLIIRGSGHKRRRRTRIRSTKCLVLPRIRFGDGRREAAGISGSSTIRRPSVDHRADSAPLPLRRRSSRLCDGSQLGPFDRGPTPTRGGAGVREVKDDQVRQALAQRIAKRERMWVKIESIVADALESGEPPEILDSKAFRLFRSTSGSRRCR
jgi:hypothetical protein